MSILNKILKWALTQEKWKQDARHRSVIPFKTTGYEPVMRLWNR